MKTLPWFRGSVQWALPCPESGPLPPIWGYPCPLLPAPVDGSLCQGVGGLPCQLVGMLWSSPILPTQVCSTHTPWSHFWPRRCSYFMGNGALTPDGEWLFRSSSRKSGKFRCTPPAYWIRSYACAGGGIEAIKKQITGVTCFAKLNGIGG